MASQSVRGASLPIRVDVLGLRQIAPEAGLRGRIASAYAIISCVAVLALAILIPPFQAPDEQQHLFRAYQLSQGQLLGRVQDGVGGGTIPSSLVELAARFLGGRALHVASGRTIDPTPLRDSLAALSTPLEPERTEFANFSNTAFYSPADYVAQSAAIVVGRAAGLGPLGLLYAARVANGLTATLVVALAVYLLPAGGAMLAVFALLPMTVFMFASASADAPMTAAALLFTALGFRAGARGSFTGGELVAAAMAGIVFCSLKPVYAPLLLIGLPGVLRSGDRKRFLFAHAAILTACIGVAGLWLHFGSSIMVPTLPWVSVPAQTEWIMAHKLVFIWVILHTVRLFATDWAREIVGKLGWHNLWVPQYTYVFPLAAAALGLTLPRPRPLRLSLLEFGWLAFLVASSVFLLLTALYLTWTGVGNGFVGGGQGRYFMPYLGILAIIVEGALPMLDRWKARIAAGGIVAIMLAQAILTCNLVAQAWHVL